MQALTTSFEKEQLLQRGGLTPRLRSHVDHYAESHRNPVNKALHFVGIPILLVSSLGLLAKVALPRSFGVSPLEPNAAWIVLAWACLWYLRSDWKTGLVTFAGVTGCYALGSGLPAWLLVFLFAVGIAAHVIGHYVFEGKPPALLSKPVAVLEAPAWLLSTWTGLYR